MANNSNLQSNENLKILSVLKHLKTKQEIRDETGRQEGEIVNSQNNQCGSTIGTCVSVTEDIKPEIFSAATSNKSQTDDDCSRNSISASSITTSNPTLSITFEDYFTNGNIQRIYFLNVLTGQVYISFLCFVISLSCTIISNQKSFLDNIDKSLNTLILNTFLLLLVESLFALVFSRYEKLNQYPLYLVKIIFETLTRMYQAGLIVFWVAFICEKCHKRSLQGNDDINLDDIDVVKEIFHYRIDDKTDANSSPIYFCVFLIYSLNLTLYLSLVLWLRFYEKAKLDNYIVHLYSLIRICGCVLISLPCIFIIRSNFPTWDISQVFIASICGLLDGFIIARSFVGQKPSTKFETKLNFTG